MKIKDLLGVKNQEVWKNFGNIYKVLLEIIRDEPEEIKVLSTNTLVEIIKAKTQIVKESLAEITEEIGFLYNQSKKVKEVTINDVF